MFVSRAHNGVLDGLSDMVEGVAIRRNFLAQPCFNPSLGVFGLTDRVKVEFRAPVRYAVRPNLMTPMDHTFHPLNVLLTPSGFAPIRMLHTICMNWVRIGDDEKCAR
jgi:hypothetical protein